MLDDLRLNDGHALPRLGFGLYKVPIADTERVVRAGLAAGYRLVDGAEFYGNERELGAALRAANEHDGIVRATLTVTSKFWGEADQSPAALRAHHAASERALGTPIDLYMLHWPRASRGQYVDAWRTLVDLRAEGRIRSIGVANFTEEHLTRLIDATGVAPSVNQVESHPWLQQRALRAFHDRHGIVTQAWSPLGRGRLLDHPTVARIASAHGRSPAQVVIRWHLQLGGALVPKSVRAERLRENRDVGFSLTDDDMDALAALERGERTGTHPDERQ